MQTTCIADRSAMRVCAAVNAYQRAMGKLYARFGFFRIGHRYRPFGWPRYELELADGDTPR